MDIFIDQPGFEFPEGLPFAMVFWTDANEELPDDEMTVLVALEDGEVWTGFHENEEWHYVSGETIPCEVLHWANFPMPPKGETINKEISEN
jgi:hypothetical protein